LDKDGSGQLGRIVHTPMSGSSYTSTTPAIKWEANKGATIFGLRLGGGGSSYTDDGLCHLMTDYVYGRSGITLPRLVSNSEYEGKLIFVKGNGSGTKVTHYGGEPRIILPNSNTGVAELIIDSGSHIFLAANGNWYDFNCSWVSGA